MHYLIMNIIDNPDFTSYDFIGNRALEKTDGSAKLGKKGWAHISSSLTQYETKILDVFRDYALAICGKTIMVKDDPNLFCGDDNYATLKKTLGTSKFDKLIEDAVVFSSKSILKKDNEKFESLCNQIISQLYPPLKTDKVNKKKQIIEMNERLMFVKEIINLNKSLKVSDLKERYAVIKRLKYVEFKCVAIIYIMDTCHNNKEIAYDIIMGSVRLKKLLKDNSSNLCFADYEKSIEKLKKKISWSQETLFDEFPQFILETSIDDIFSLNKIEVYPSQSEVVSELVESMKQDIFQIIFNGKVVATYPIDKDDEVNKFIKSNYEHVKDISIVSGRSKIIRTEHTIYIRKVISPLLILNKTMIGSGKTMTAFIIAYMLSEMRKKSDGTPRLIFCCSNDIVRKELGRFCYNHAAIHLGFIVWQLNPHTGEYDYKISYSTPNKSDGNNVDILIGDVKTVHSFLRDETMRGSTNRYILFMDEPTMSADRGDINVEIMYMMSIICQYSPEKLILVSATLPEESKIEFLINHFKYLNRFVGETRVHVIKSNNSHIGSRIINYDGTVYQPHNYSSNAIELATIIKNIKENPFLERMYTANNLFGLINDACSAKFNCPRIDSYFRDDPEHFSQIFIQKLALDTLNKIVDDDIDLKDDKIAVTFRKERHVSEKMPDSIKKLSLDVFYRFKRGCLVLTNNPVKKAIDMCNTLLDIYEKKEMTEYNYSKYHNIDKYVDRLKEYKEHSEKIAEKLKGDNENEFKRASDAEMMTETFDNAPKWEFINALTIGSVAHSSLVGSKIQGSKTRVSSFHSIPYESNADDVIKLLACMGIYIYKPDKFDDVYNQCVIKAAMNGDFAYIVSDGSIAYGTNGKFNEVILDDADDETFINDHSLETIFQAIGRAGRKGKSDSANIYCTGSSFKERMIKLVRGDLDQGDRDEAKNMLKTYHALMNGATEWINSN